MNILIVSEPIHTNEAWRDIITLANPNATIYSVEEHQLASFDRNKLKDLHIVICLFKNTNRLFHDLLSNCHFYQIPVLCVVDEDINRNIYTELFSYGVKGFIGREMSVESLKKVIRIVKEGGIYIEPTNIRVDINMKISVPPTQKPMLDVTEWKVFSLTSKGYTKEEIAELLQTTDETIADYQKLIVNKTSSKTLSGAVAQGINSGWLNTL
ncbi:MAG: hypothetical protein R3267_05610 [Paenisporosarcina sp.]|nr:hypothetical protein [Paenisporosarcina sp.]